MPFEITPVYYAIGAIVLLLLIVAGLYNAFISLKNKVDEAWADIDTQLKRRYDLIPNVVESVKGYAAHEKSTFEKVTSMRAQAMSAKTPAEKAKTENIFTEALKSLFAVAENYPELKANQNFLDLQSTLREIEEHLQMSRRYYNGIVRDYNIKIESFPNNLLAKMFSFGKREFFEVNGETERAAPKVAF